MGVLTLISLFSLLAPTLCYETGAPSISCKTMIPQHGVPPQTTPSPYKVMLSKTQLEVNSPLEITLTSKSGRDEFKGFLIQIRMNATTNSQTGEIPFGDFVESEENSRTLACFNTPNNAMTHKDPKPKKMVKVHWMPQHPGKYILYTTIAKDGSTFWANQPHHEVIEVLEDSSIQETDYDWKALCSDMKLNSSLSPETESSNPYQFMIGQVPMGAVGGKEKHAGDSHKIEQMGLMWINVTSPFDTPIMKMFLQVRRPKNPSKSYGKFVMKTGAKEGDKLTFKPVDCFGGKGNAILFANLGHRLKKISDVSVQWEAPQDETGDFEVLGTILTEEDLFWDKIGEDVEMRKIKVVKGSGSSPTSRQTKTTTGGKKSSSQSYHAMSITSILFGTALCFLATSLV